MKPLYGSFDYLIGFEGSNKNYTKEEAQRIVKQRLEI